MAEKMKLIISMLMIAVFMTFSACEESGEEVTAYGTIKGTIKDFEELTPLEGVTITTNPISSTVKTDENGDYILDNLIPGEYTLTIRKTDYATESGNKKVEEYQIVIVDFLMEESIVKNSPPEFLTDSLYPEDNSKKIPLDFKFRWSANDPDSEDEINYDIILYKENDIKGIYLAQEIKDTTYQSEDLEYNTIYRWQVIARDEEGDETQSDIFTFKTLERPEHPILFSQIYNGSYEIFASDDTGNNIVQLSNGPYINWNPRRSPVNNQIAYVSNADGDFNIYIMEYGAKISNKITVIPIAGYHNPGTGYCWSANGGQIFYTHYDKIYKVNNDGSGLETFAQAPEGKHFRMVDYSRYNNMILGLTNEIDGYANSIILYDSDGNIIETVLDTLQGTISSATFSIDGSKILYCYDNSGLQADDGRQLDVRIYEYTIETGDFFDLSGGKTMGTNDTNARYSGTGAEIIFENGYNNSSKKDIYIITSDGGSRTLLFENASLPDW